MALVSNIKDKDWVSVRQAAAKLGSQKLGPGSVPTFGGLNLNGTLDMNDNAIVDVGYIDFDLINGIAAAEGRLVWNDTDGTLNLGLKGGTVNLQIGQEHVIRATNKTGVTITNGTPVYLFGVQGNRPTIAPADSDFATGVGFRTIGVATEDILNNDSGYVTTRGLVRGVDTRALVAGLPLYLKNGGGYQQTPPAAPDITVIMGQCITAVEDGILLIDVTTIPNLSALSDVDLTSIANKDIVWWDTSSNTWLNKPHANLFDAFNGTFLETIDFTIAESGGTVTGSLEQDSGGDLTQVFSDGFTTLDTTPALTIDLTAYVGTNAVPKEVFVYILQSAKTVITASNSDWPATEHIKIANLLLKSAVTTGTDGGALVNRNWNDHAKSADGQGHITHIENRIRQEPTQWDNGVALTLKNAGGTELTTTNSSTAVELVTTVGAAYQLHKQVFPAFDMYTTGTDDAHITNQPTDEGGAYETTVDLVTDITHYVDGTAAGVAIGVNKYFNLVVWGIVNRSGEPSHIMINLPTSQYTTSSNAVADVDGTSVFEIPSAFKGKGFLIARLTFRLIGGSQWTYIAQEDLRGKFPDIIAGVGITTTDHALLANLTAPADDHTQYHTDARAATWLAANHETTYTHSNIALNTTHRGLVAGNPHVVTPTELSLVIGTDVLAEQTIGIADDNLLEVDDADAADDDYAKFTANGLEGRSATEVVSDLGIGSWTTPSYSAGDFTANGAMVWTVEAADVITYSYIIIDKLMFVNFWLQLTTIGGTPNTKLRIAIPASKQSANSVQTFYLANPNSGGNQMGLLTIQASGTVMELHVDFVPNNWPASTNLTHVFGSLFFEIN